MKLKDILKKVPESLEANQNALQEQKVLLNKLKFLQVIEFLWIIWTFSLIMIKWLGYVIKKYQRQKLQSPSYIHRHLNKRWEFKRWFILAIKMTLKLATEVEEATTQEREVNSLLPDADSVTRLYSEVLQLTKDVQQEENKLRSESSGTVTFYK